MASKCSLKLWPLYAVLQKYCISSVCSLKNWRLYSLTPFVHLLPPPASFSLKDHQEHIRWPEKATKIQMKFKLWTEQFAVWNKASICSLKLGLHLQFENEASIVRFENRASICSLKIGPSFAVWKYGLHLQFENMASICSLKTWPPAPLSNA